MGARLISGFLILSLLAAFPWRAGGAYPAVGRPAPPFLVTSGDDEQLTLDMLRGKIIVLFYESRNVVKRNLGLKNALKALYESQPADIRNQVFRLVVIDCAEAFLPTLPIWKNKLMEHSRKEGFTIYGDWTRRMLKDYRLNEEDSNFLIIDKQGIIRFSASGKIGSAQIDPIKTLLLELVQRGQ